MFKKIRCLTGNTFFRIEDSFGKYKLNLDRKIVSILTYHGLETDPGRLVCNYLDITPESCLKEIRFYQRQGYKLISIDELDCLRDPPGPIRAGRRYTNNAWLIISFDDGFLNTFEHIRDWLKDERIPVMLAICPELVENNGIFWWDEVRARFQLMKTDTIEFEIDNVKSYFTKNDIVKFEERCERLPHNNLLSLLCQLRNKTDYISEDQIRDSKYYREIMKWDDINLLAEDNLFSIASHSLAHELAINIPEQKLKENTIKSRQMIKEKTGYDTKYYVYPGGKCSEKTDEVLNQCGFTHTFSTDASTNYLDSIKIRLNRFRGIGYGSTNLRYYAHKWNKEHKIMSPIS